MMEYLLLTLLRSSLTPATYSKVYGVHWILPLLFLFSVWLLHCLCGLVSHCFVGPLPHAYCPLNYPCLVEQTWGHTSQYVPVVMWRLLRTFICMCRLSMHTTVQPTIFLYMLHSVQEWKILSLLSTLNLMICFCVLNSWLSFCFAKCHLLNHLQIEVSYHWWYISTPLLLP